MSFVLVTGGAGYIGAHCCVALIEAGFKPVIFDNFSNTHRTVVERLEQITGTKVAVIDGDVRDAEAVNRVFEQYEISSVIHFAALKAVGESVAKPLEYFDNNVSGTLVLLNAMRRAGVKTFVFSSSATVYGDADQVPITENAPRSASNPYGRSKLIVEDMLADLSVAEPDWRIASLRYFNPTGAHKSGLIGEDPSGVPNNLMPYVAQVAVGKREILSVFGNDYPTKDGTGVRDFIHVTDLADGHVSALHYLEEKGGHISLNLGTGHGYSVLEIIQAFEQASGKEVPYKIVERRPGDVAECWADPALAQSLLGWSATRSLKEMCDDVWRWQHNNPNGYSA